MRIKGGGRGSTNAAGSGRTTARVRHHQGKYERDSREEQALRDGALPWLGVVIYSLGLPSWVLVLGAGRRWPFLTYPGRRQILERRPPTARGTRTIVAHGATFFIRADRPDCCGAVGTTPAPRKSCQMGAVRRVGSRAPLQRCYNVFGGLATAKGATATDLKLCRRSAPHATRRGRSGQPPNSARTCLSTHNKRLARWFVF